jgi:hypothetical protein
MAKFVVVDAENESAIGPFDSKDEAKAYFVKMSHDEDWLDVVDLIERTGSPFVNNIEDRNSASGMLGLILVELDEPSPSIRSAITY